MRNKKECEELCRGSHMKRKRKTILKVLPPLWTNIEKLGRSHHSGRAATPSVSLRLV